MSEQPVSQSPVRLWKWPAIVLAVVALLVACSYLLFRLAFGDYLAEMKTTRDRLLNEVNYGRTVAEARQLMEQYPVGEVFQEGDERLPEYLLHLSPKSVLIGDDQVWIEFAGGFYHTGFVALRRGGSPGDIRQDLARELIEGLWFYEGE